MCFQDARRGHDPRNVASKSWKRQRNRLFFGVSRKNAVMLIP